VGSGCPDACSSPPLRIAKRTLSATTIVAIQITVLLRATSSHLLQQTKARIGG
jgi:hypothetical protein